MSLSADAHIHRRRAAWVVLPVLGILLFTVVRLSFAPFLPKGDLPGVHDLSDQGEVMEDPTNLLTFADVQSPQLTLPWTPIRQPGHRFGQDEVARFVRLPLSLPGEGSHYLIVSNPWFQGISLHIPGHGPDLLGGTDRAAGDQSRPGGSFFVFPLPGDLVDGDVIYLRVRAGPMLPLLTSVVDQRGLLTLQRTSQVSWLYLSIQGLVLLGAVLGFLHVGGRRFALLVLGVGFKLLAQYLSTGLPFVGAGLSVDVLLSLASAVDLVGSGAVLQLMVLLAGDALGPRRRLLLHALSFLTVPVALLMIALGITVSVGLAGTFRLVMGVLIFVSVIPLMWPALRRDLPFAGTLTLGYLCGRLGFYISLILVFQAGISIDPAQEVLYLFSVVSAFFLAYAVGLDLVRQVRQDGEKLQAEVQILSTQEANRARALAQLSKVLRHPLLAIAAHLQSLLEREQLTLSPSMSEGLHRLRREVQVLAELAADLLDLDRISAGTASVKREVVDVRVLLQDIEQLNRALVRGKQLKLSIDLSASELCVLGDGPRLAQVLQLLVSNALETTDRGSIRLSAVRVGEWVRIIAQDTGRGLDEEELGRVRSLLAGSTQSDADQSDMDVEYLGLRVARDLMRLQAGTIGCTSAPGRGSCFTLQMTASEAAPAPDLAPDGTRAGGHWGRAVEDGEREGQFNILVVDDEEINRRILAGQLAISGYNVTEARDGMEALDMVEREAPDLILMDIMMPHMSGLDVCRRLRERHSPNDLPVIFMTANTQSADIVEGLEAGGNDYQVKPHSRQELLARIRTHIQLSKLTQAYSRFVPREFLRVMHRDSILEVKLGEQVQREMTVMFCDIRSFTTLSESMSPRENFNFLNSYLARVAPAIQRNRGFIDKYIGDGIMALFGDDPEDAIRAAVEIRGVLREYNTHRARCGYRGIDVGVGLHTGKLILGTIGYEDRMESTVISDAVNLASRLESLTKVFGVTVLISEDMLLNTPKEAQVAHRYLGCVQVKGKTRSISVFEVIAGETPEQVEFRVASREIFEEGVRAFEARELDVAMDRFRAVLAANPADLPAELFLERCLEASMPFDGTGEGAYALGSGRFERSAG